MHAADAYLLADDEAFRRARLDAVTGPLGDASLVGTFWIAETTELADFPGIWDIVAGDQTALFYTPPADHSVSIDGVAVQEPLLVRSRTSDEGKVLVWGASLRATVLHWPGIGLAIRLWDVADVSVTSLAGIETYPFDPAWQIEGDYKPLDQTVAYAYHGHGGRFEGRHVVGEVTVAVESLDYTLLVTRNASGLTAVFGDLSNGKETYGGGRFVPVALLDNGRAVVDFTRAILPPCAFSPHFDCPLPPASNIIRSLVRAGEKQIVRHALSII